MIKKTNNCRSDAPADPPRSSLLPPHEVAAMLGISEATLSTWRCRGRYNLPYVKVGSRVMYRLQAVENFLSERERGAPNDE